MRMTTNNHEVIFAIVNSGFAEDVMEVARQQGVRGGTILNARGVAREDAAAFFGITLHAEKEILMMVVEKDIRDSVLNAIYKEMGMAKAAQGIFAFFAIRMFRSEGSTVRVQVNGETVGEYFLSEDGEYSLNGGTNILVIKDGYAYIKTASCPDHLCVRSGKIFRAGEQIVCLPNRLSVEVLGDTGGYIER